MSEGTKIYGSPDELLSELGVDKPCEIDIEAIAEFCGATIVYEPLVGCEARIVGLNNRAIITVNSSSPIGRRRFSAGHELGHWMFDRGKVSFGCDAQSFLSDWTSHSPEVRANRFSANLLMPRSMFEDSARKREITFSSVHELCETYLTSVTATAIRLVECGSYPAIIVCSSGLKRRWFFRAKSVPNDIWPNEIIGKITTANDLLSTAKAAGPDEVRADQWINHTNSAKYWIHEDSIRVGEYILSLLWWKDGQQLLDLDEDGVNF